MNLIITDCEFITVSTKGAGDANTFRCAGSCCLFVFHLIYHCACIVFVLYVNGAGFLFSSSPFPVSVSTSSCCLLLAFLALLLPTFGGILLDLIIKE